MKITCDSCQSKYTISDEKVQGKTVKIKCRKCGATLVVTSGGVTTNGTAGAGAGLAGGAGDAGPAAGSYLVNVADGDQRTMTLNEIIGAYNEGAVDQETYVWADGMDDWQPLAQVGAIVEALHASAPAPAGATAPQQALDAGMFSDPTPMAPDVSPQPQPHEERRAAVVKRDGRRGTQDLFGEAGAEVVTSAPNAFDGGPGGMGASASSAQPAGATGQRNETSVLFSLAALTKTGSPTSVAPSSGPGGPGGKKDDSGLIDLKALSASANAGVTSSSSAQPQFGSFGLSPMTPFGAPLAPIGMDALTSPAVGSTIAPPPSKNRALIFVFGGTAIALILIFGVFFAVRGSGEKQVAPQASAAPTTTETVAAAPTTPEPTPTASDTASAAPAPSPVAAKPKAPGYKPPPGGAKPPPAAPGAGPTPPPAAPPAAKPPAATGKCGCSPSDLMCQMKCSAGR